MRNTEGAEGRFRQALEEAIRTTGLSQKELAARAKVSRQTCFPATFLGGTAELPTLGILVAAAEPGDWMPAWERATAAEPGSRAESSDSYA